MINPKDAEVQITYLQDKVKALSSENIALKERLRDEFAMSIDLDITDFNQEQINVIAGEAIPPITDIIGRIKYWARVDAKLRYLYADEAIKAREIKNV